ncbi:laminin subunit alpha-1 [Bacillus rossius redtenbacheri]|uniref:laminin subunit alpha-1 n=1 Tax=Bacillus rossius redtenbacheri TaxID=93214 RepID=UPI002FDE95C5
MRLWKLCLFTFLLAWIRPAHADSTHDSVVKKGSGGGLFPPLVDAAAGALVRANATCCGEDSPHPPRCAADGDPGTWWQSPSLQRGARYEWVTLTLDLRQVYQVSHVTVKAAVSPRPANCIVERSLDGSTYLPWQYHARTDEECVTRYGVPPTRDEPDSEVTCTSRYSAPHPPEGGEMHVSLPGADSSSEQRRARYVRLRLQGLHEVSTPRASFYSVGEVVVIGRCACSGHADECVGDGEHGQPRCRCQHHTCGELCDRCCPLHNARPWRAGTPRDPHPCEACECHGHAASCRYDPRLEAGVCEDCSAHTTGINCERCEDGWYRPNDISPYDSEPCRPCDCSNLTSTNRCSFDSENEANAGGVCECLPGYSGPRCDRCSPGLRGFPLCQPRNRDERSVGCGAGSFGPEEGDPDGCTPCYCSGVSRDCEEARLYLHDTETLSGWLVSDPAVARTVLPTADADGRQLTVASDELPGVDTYYWLAPDQYRGSRLASYGTDLTFRVSWVVMRGDTSGRPSSAPDVILVGKNGVRLGFGEKAYQEQNATINVPLREGAWYHLPHEGRRTDIHGSWVTRDQLLAVLADVKHMLLRAKFHTDQVEGSLWKAVLRTGRPEVSSAAARGVESCRCPPGYEGLSCESCRYGHARAGRGECRRCDCSGHAPTCDPASGQCAACEHNTTGAKCEECLPGFYGDATIGTPSDCQPCACPLPDPANNFSPTCERRGSDGRSYVCTACPVGFAGDHCEQCGDGYHGNPRLPGSACRPCECHGGPCDGATGQCLECRGNTEGWSCERCRDGHYGDPSAADCRPCQCSTKGSAHPHTCDPQTGQCRCLEKYVGRTCSHCEEGHGNVTAGCPPCSCDPAGSTAATCDPVTGQCPCLPGVGGARCDACQERHYGFSPSGCSGCNCHPVGSTSSMCDIVTGQCSCKVHVSGRTCDTCQDGFWGLSMQGCQPCECDAVGSASHLCDILTGQCPCLPGVGGKHCDSCLPEFYGFSVNGCSRCDVCVKAGHVCDPDTGRCVCPQLTQGNTCNRCQPSSWGFEPGKGCKSTIEWQVLGMCACASLRETSDGKSTRVFQTNVEGKRCDRCKVGTFGLQADNVDGCTQCFCFGRTTACTQAGLIWSQILAGLPRSLSVEFTVDSPSRFRLGDHNMAFIQLTTPGSGEQQLRGRQAKLNVTNGLVAVPGVSGDVRLGSRHLFDKPLYWELPRQFLGDKILSYGGFLQFTTETEDGRSAVPPHVLAHHPLVQLQGNWQIVLEYFPILPNPLGRHKIRLHESLWHLRSDRRQKVSREMFMLALQNVQHIFIRASDFLDFSKVVLRDVTLDTAVSAPGRPYPLARGVELCDCPPEYNSTSCQDPSVGFYRYHDVNSVQSTIVIQLVGEARPCQCNNRSAVCDIETGRCLNCSQNTGGEHCERCGEGFYGNPSRGGCRSCPCPRPDHNFAVGCRVTPQRTICKCKQGYRGKFCDSCAYGWFGFPGREGGSCQPCRCNQHGSVSDECDERTGQCNCRPGITSRDCSACSGRSVLTTSGCSSCDDGCTGVLLDKLDDMGSLLGRKTGHLSGGLVPPPWGALAETEDNHTRAADALREREQAVDRARALPGNAGDELKRKANKLLQRATHVLGKCTTASKNASSAKTEAEDIFRKLQVTQREIDGVLQLLDGYGQGEAGIVSISAVLKEARRLLSKIKAHNFERNKQASNRTLQGRIKSHRDSSSASYPNEWQEKVSIEGVKMMVKLDTGAQVMRSRLARERPSLPRTPCQFGSSAQLTDRGGPTSHGEATSFVYIESNVRKIENQLQHIQELLKTLPNLTPVKGRQSDFENKLSDLDNILRDIGGKISESQAVSSSNRGKLDQVKSYSDEIMSLDEEVNRLLNKGQSFTSDGVELLEDTSKYLNDSKEALSELRNLTRLVEVREGILYRLSHLYREKYVIPVQQHANMLVERALNYTALFGPTRHNATFALRASKAYQDIVDALASARKAAINARSAGESAYKTAHPDNEDNILDKSLISVANSDRLVVRAKQKKDETEVLLDEYNKQQKIVKKIEETVKTAAENDNFINRELSKLENEGNASQQTVKEALLKLSGISATSSDTHQQATNIIDNVRNKLRPRLNSLDIQLQLDFVENNITQGLNNVRFSDELLTRLATEAEEKKRRYEKLNASIADKLQELRNKIMKARHTASGIHVSLKSREDGEGRGCVRSYHATNLQPSTTTSIVLNYAIESKQRDGLLMYLPSSTTNDFVAIEMVDRHVRFVWDVGHGSGSVQHPLEIMTGGLKEDKFWYRIEVHRTSNVAKLVVRPQISPENASQADGASAPGYGQFDVGPDDKVWVGGIPSSVRRPPDLKTASVGGLPGCLYELTLDGRPVGLWNFADEIYSGGCVGCIQGAEELKDESTYYFTGDGYSSFRRTTSSPYKKFFFTVSFRFRTLDENAMLFLAIDPGKVGFISLSLIDGQIVFFISYDGSPPFRIRTAERHNHGNWTLVEASRYFHRKKNLEECVLKVEGENQTGAPSERPSLSAIPDLSSASYFVGGVPPGFSPGPNSIEVLDSFMGCMADIQVEQEGYNPLHGQFYGVEATCRFEPEVAGFLGDGFFQLASHSLEKKAAFGLSFRTLQPDALILLSTFQGTGKASPGPETRGYYSVSLVGGFLEVRADAGKGKARLVSKSKYNNGHYHALGVVKNGRRLKLRVDDLLENSKALPEGATVVRAPGSIGGLYLGGVPHNFSAGSMASSTTPLFGTIKDVIFNEQVIQFNKPITFRHVSIGRQGTLPKQMVSRSTNHVQQELEMERKRCQDVPSYSLEPGAVKFGDSANSHVQIRRRTAVHEDFIFEMDFRTFYPNGLLFIIPSSRGRQRHYLMAALKDQRLQVVVRWRRKLQVAAASGLNDGAWHHVAVRKAGRRLLVEVDALPPQAARAKFPKKMNLGSTMYVGGLPQNNLPLPEMLVQKHEGFKGCIRNLAINKQSQDLVGEKTLHSKVGQCFPQVERGSYFPGDAYAIYKNKFLVGAQLELQLEFRTTELSGVLLSVSEPRGYPALSLEINSGKILMVVDIGDRRPLRVVQGFPSPFALCDNRWHSIKAYFVNDELTLKVDSQNSTYGHSGNGLLSEAETNSPLYIGGLPENAPSGTLETRDNFKGCIRNVVIGAARKDWTDMAGLHNILLSSCPISP